MSEFHEGRVAATFQVGARLENTKEAYENEIVGIDGAKHALVGALKVLDDYRKSIKQEGIDAKIPIREADLGVKYVTGCLEIVQRLLGETEGKRYAAVGAIEALKRVVADTKKLWDQETAKLKEIQAFEAESPRDMTHRPVGYMPKEHPLEELKQEEDKAPDEPPRSAKKTRKTPKPRETQG